MIWMGWLVGSMSSKAKLSGSDLVIKIGGESLLEKRCKYFVHGLGKRYRTIVREISSISLCLFNDRNDL